MHELITLWTSFWVVVGTIATVIAMGYWSNQKGFGWAYGILLSAFLSPVAAAIFIMARPAKPAQADD